MNKRKSFFGLRSAWWGFFFVFFFYREIRIFAFFSDNTIKIIIDLEKIFLKFLELLFHLHKIKIIMQIGKN